MNLDPVLLSHNDHFMTSNIFQLASACLLQRYTVLLLEQVSRQEPLLCTQEAFTCSHTYGDCTVDICWCLPLYHHYSPLRCNVFTAVTDLVDCGCMFWAQDSFIQCEYNIQQVQTGSSTPWFSDILASAEVPKLVATCFSIPLLWNPCNSLPRTDEINIPLYLH